MHALTKNHSSPYTKGLGDRKFCRGDVAIAGTIRAIGGMKSPIKVVDISTSGFRMECLTYLSDSQVIFLTMHGYQPMEAKIIWQTEWMYGCAFARPLHMSVYEHIVRSNPSFKIQPTDSDGFIYGAAAGRQWNGAA